MKFYIIFLAVIGAASAGFGAKGKSDIVKAHNDLRSSIANGTYVAKGTPLPTASDMLKMSWDDSIAQCAQTYADSCPDDHSEVLNWYGENLYWWIGGEIKNLDSYGVEATKRWKKEFQEKGWLSTTFDQATYDFGIAHSTQMIWSKTNLIGCGVKNCGVDPKNGWNKLIVVCQYKEYGNVHGEKIYEEGATCSACPSSSSCENSTGLCTGYQSSKERISISKCVRNVSVRGGMAHYTFFPIFFWSFTFLQ